MFRIYAFNTNKVSNIRRAFWYLFHPTGFWHDDPGRANNWYINLMFGWMSSSSKNHNQWRLIPIAQAIIVSSTQDPQTRLMGIARWTSRQSQKGWRAGVNDFHVSFSFPKQIHWWLEHCRAVEDICVISDYWSEGMTIEEALREEEKDKDAHIDKDKDQDNFHLTWSFEKRQRLLLSLSLLS